MDDKKSRLTVSFEAEEKRNLQNSADACGLTMAAFIRMAVADMCDRIIEKEN